MSENIAAKVVDLRKQVEANQKLRSDAEAHLALAKSRLQQIDNRLIEVGINPENVNADLRDLETQFEASYEKLKIELSEEAQRYNEIISKSKATIGEARS